MDLHDPQVKKKRITSFVDERLTHKEQFQGFFDCPVDNLSSLPSMAKYIHFNIPDYKEAVIVSPDAGGAKR